VSEGADAAGARERVLAQTCAGVNRSAENPTRSGTRRRELLPCRLPGADPKIPPPRTTRHKRGARGDHLKFSVFRSSTCIAISDGATIGARKV